jgi:hypothetical protein
MRHELDWPKTQAVVAGFGVIRSSTAAGAASRWLAVSIVPDDVEPGGSPPKVRSHSGDDSEQNLLHFALRATPLRFTTEEFLVARDESVVLKASYECALTWNKDTTIARFPKMARRYCRSRTDFCGFRTSLYKLLLVR